MVRADCRSSLVRDPRRPLLEPALSGGHANCRSSLAHDARRPLTCDRRRVSPSPAVVPRRRSLNGGRVAGLPGLPSSGRGTGVTAAAPIGLPPPSPGHPPARDPRQPPRLSVVAASDARRPPQLPVIPGPRCPAATPTAGHPWSAMPDAPSRVIVAEFLRLGPLFRGDDHRMAVERAGLPGPGARPPAATPTPGHPRSAAPGGHPNARSSPVRDARRPLTGDRRRVSPSRAVVPRRRSSNGQSSGPGCRGPARGPGGHPNRPATPIA